MLKNYKYKIKILNVMLYKYSFVNVVNGNGETVLKNII